jgi:hypothetical protein
MAKLKKICNDKNINISRKLNIYKTLVKPILIYNYGTWGLTKNEEKELDEYIECRKHLRRVLMERYT